MLISFEGIDGTGKATQALLFKEYLSSVGIDSIYFDFPAYESFVGKEIGKLLSSDNSDDPHDALTLPPKLMAMLFALDRMQFYQAIHEALANNQVVITNRFSLSNSVFQSIRAGENISEWVDKLEHEALKLPRPDCYIILLGSLNASKELVTAKGERNYTESHDIYEKNESLLKSAQEFYSNISTPLSTRILVNCISESSFRTREDIHNEIIEKVMPEMNKQKLNQVEKNEMKYLVNISDKVWGECRNGYRINLDCVKKVLKGVPSYDYLVVKNIFTKNSSVDVFSRIINKSDGNNQNNDLVESEINKLSVFISAISYASNIINDMINYPAEIRREISMEICDTLNINNDDLISLDKEWGRMFYSA